MHTYGTMQNWKMRVVILNHYPRASFYQNMCGFSGVFSLHAPFFFEDAIHSGGHEKNYYFSPGDPPPQHITPKCVQIPKKKLLILKVGVLEGKGRTPGES